MRTLPKESTQTTATPASAWRVLRTFAPVLWRHRTTVAGAYAAGLVAIAATVVTPWPLKFIIDSVIGQHPLPPAVAALSQGFSSHGLVLLLAGVAAVVATLGVVFSGIENNVNARLRERMTLELRDQLLEHVQTMSVTVTARLRSGEIVMRITSDVHLLVRLFTKTAPTIIIQAVGTVVILGVMYAIEPRIGLLGLAMVMLLVWLTRRYVHPLHEASRAKRRGEGDVSALAQEIVRGLPSVQVLSAEDSVRERFRQDNLRSLNAGVRQTRVAVALQRSTGISKGLAIAIVTGGGAWLVLDGSLTIGALTVCVAYLAELLRPVSKINELATTVSRSIMRGEQLLALLDLRPAVADRPGAIDLPRTRGGLELRSVAFEYPHDDPQRPRAKVLHDIDLVLEPGSFTMLTGRSGEGKTTLLRLMLRLFDPSAGELRLDGARYRDVTLRSLRAQFAVMLQDTHLFAGSIREALQPAEGALADRILWDMLSKVAMHDFVQALPGGLDAALFEDGLNLSGGQRARLSLARALLQQRPFLLLDEPLANIDMKSQTVILKALEAIRGEVTCLAISHQSALAALADSVLQLDAGRLLPAPAVCSGATDSNDDDTSRFLAAAR